MLNLLNIDDLSQEDIYKIWDSANNGTADKLEANIAWSFEGNGIRTRTTFVQTFQTLGVNFVELPNFLKTNESVEDLASYMDAFYSMYVIRESNHQRLKAFAAATTKPIINAMSSEAHPCEVLTDAYYLSTKFESLTNVRILLWGPVTNVFKSWHSLSGVLGLNMTHYCPSEYHQDTKNVTYTDQLTGHYDVVITDAWPKGFSDSNYCLSNDHLRGMSSPMVLPTPPVTVGNELKQPLYDTENFVGYEQKALLLPIQIAIVSYLLSKA
ncbi:ornithine carbamoyltransferase [Leucothrix arctica]|uniref:Ornithine carbamoyltransferase n=1 Tax=Leucothrix arctica TaxID=1481894 RepID=A0A317CM06_9GAMM|nr:ornithine carbamoyltransferase [Leucothrix arctica]PWQ99556.1 ornithine carbamoyltransferase [Leucothrix arctica]